MIVRDAITKDKDEVSKLYTSFCSEFGVPADMPPSISEGKLVVCQNSFCLIGYGSAKCVEYGGKSYTQGEHIYVKPEFRKTKAGGYIYSALRRWAKKEQRPIILLSGVDEYDKWHKLGYKTIRYIMVKEIKCMK